MKVFRPWAAVLALLPNLPLAAEVSGDLFLRDAIYLYGQNLDAKGSKVMVGVNCDVLQLVLDVEAGFTDLAMGESATSSADALLVRYAYPDRIDSSAPMFAYALTAEKAYKTFQFRDTGNATASTSTGTGTVFGYCFSTVAGARVYLQETDRCTNRLSNGSVEPITPCSPDAGSSPPPADPLLITPFVYSSDINSVTPYSAGTNSPWGWRHDGLDFMPAADGRLFRAPLSGLVEDVILWTLPNPNLGNQELWQVNVIIKHDETYRYAYAFETFSASEADGQAQRNMIAVAKGQKVAQGDIIGGSHVANPAVQVTVHFSFIKDGVSICPEPYFSAEARNSILQLIHRNHPDWVFCF